MQLVHQSAGAVETNRESTLNHTCRALLRHHHGAGDILEQRVGEATAATTHSTAIATTGFDGGFGQFNRFDGTGLCLDILVDALHFGCIDEGALHAHRLVSDENQHIAASHELVGTFLVENRARVDLRHHAERHSTGEVRLNRTCDDVRRRALRGDNHMDADGTRFLRDAGDGQFDFLACGHNQVAKLVDDHDDIRHIFVAFRQVEFVVHKLLVVFLDAFHVGVFEQFVATVHQFAERVERAHDFRHVGDDWFFLVFGQRGHKMARNRLVEAEFHHFRIDEHKFQFIRMLFVEQRGDNRV